MGQGKMDVAKRPLPASSAELEQHGSLQCLSMSHILAIDEALAAVGDYGEVRLIKSRGKLRFVQTLRSEPLACTK